MKNEGVIEVSNYRVPTALENRRNGVREEAREVRVEVVAHGVPIALPGVNEACSKFGDNCVPTLLELIRDGLGEEGRKIRVEVVTYSFPIFDVGLDKDRTKGFDYLIPAGDHGLVKILIHPVINYGYPSVPEQPRLEALEQTPVIEYLVPCD